MYRFNLTSIVAIGGKKPELVGDDPGEVIKSRLVAGRGSKKWRTGIENNMHAYLGTPGL